MSSSKKDDDSTVNVDASKVRNWFEEQSQQAYLVVVSGPRTGEMFGIESSGLVIGRDREQVDIWFGNPSVSRRHVEITRHEGGEVRLTDLNSSNGTYVNGQLLRDSTKLAEGDKITLGSNTILKFTFHDELDTHFQKELYESSIRDELTGAHTKAYLLDQLRSEMSFAGRADRDLGLILFDLDHFKQLNDEHGHVVGDKILAELAALCRQNLREEDLFARYGGEEFVVLARETGIRAAKQAAERIRKAIGSHEFEVKGEVHRVTISVGISSLFRSEASTPSELISSADEALYEAKDAGRNCVNVYRAEEYDPRETIRTDRNPGNTGMAESS